MTNLRLPKTPQRRLSRKLHDLKATMFGHCRTTLSTKPQSPESYGSQHSMITMSPVNSPFRVALQNTDTATDSIVITSLYFPGGVPFTSHQDLLDMDRQTLLSLARMLNDKLPKAMQIMMACSTPDVRTQIEQVVGIKPQSTGSLEPIVEDKPMKKSSPPSSPCDRFSLSGNVQSPRNKSSVLGTPSLARLIEVEEPTEGLQRPIKRRKVSGLAYGAELHLLSPTRRLSGPRVRNPLPLLRSNSAQESPSPRYPLDMRRASSLKLPSEMEIDTAFITLTRPKYNVRKLEAPPSQPVTPKSKVPLRTRAGLIMLDANAVRKVQDAFPEVLASSTNTMHSPVLDSTRVIKPLPRDLQGKIRTGLPVKPSNSANELSTSQSYVSVFAFPASRSVSPHHTPLQPRKSSPSTPTKHRYAPVASSPLATHPPLSTPASILHRHSTFRQDENIGLGVTQSKVFLCTPNGRLSGSDADSNDTSSASPGSSFYSSDDGAPFALSDRAHQVDEDVFGKKRMLESSRRAPNVRGRNAKKRAVRIQKAPPKQKID